MEAELRADEKERAEHVMLVDLGRNDVGRVCELASIELPRVMEVERYSHVMHLSSTVTGRLREGLDGWDALRKTLPVGTVSGAPKIRAMQIIDELEPSRRGPYAGGIGYVGFGGALGPCAGAPAPAGCAAAHPHPRHRHALRARGLPWRRTTVSCRHGEIRR